VLKNAGQHFRTNPAIGNSLALVALFIALGGVGYASLIPKNTVGKKQIKTNGVGALEIAAGAVGSEEIADGSVSGADIGDGAVGLADLGANSVNGGKVVNGSLLGEDVSDGTLDGNDIGDGTIGLADLGADSVDSSKVADGTLTGDDVLNGTLTGGDVVPGTFLGGRVTVQFTQAAADLANGAETSIDVHCLDGQIALGGGARGDLTNSELTKIVSSRPIISTSNSGAPGDGGTFTGWRATVVNENNGAGIRPEVWVVCAG
jgi:hypothetical protein